MPSRKKSPPEPIGKVIDDMLKAWGMSRSSKELRVFQVWDRAIAEPVRGNARPVFVSRGQLVVAVRDNVWMQELGFIKDELKKKLNRELGPGVIQEIRFKIGAWSESPPEPEAGAPPEPELDPQIIEEAERTVAAIPDPRLREQVKKTLLAATKREAIENEDEPADENK